MARPSGFNLGNRVLSSQHISLDWVRGVHDSEIPDRPEGRPKREDAGQKLETANVECSLLAKQRREGCAVNKQRSYEASFVTRERPASLGRNSATRISCQS